MIDIETIQMIVTLLYGILLGSAGNILYRARNEMRISPIYLRILTGILSMGAYVIFSLWKFNGVINKDPWVMLIIFVIGFFAELMVETIEDKFPKIIDKAIEFKFGRKGSDDNEKK